MSTHRRRSPIAVGAIALLCLWGTPQLALAETDVVLSNESQGTDVDTGDSSFSNSETTSSQSTTFDPPGASKSGLATQGASSSAPALSGAAQAAAPAKTKQAVQTHVQAQFDAMQKVADLFVGLPMPGGSVLP